jgi:hypothetical protein
MKYNCCDSTVSIAAGYKLDDHGLIPHQIQNDSLQVIMARAWN